MIRILGSEKVFATLKDSRYFIMIYVFHTSVGPVWHLDNISKALYDDADYIPGGIALQGINMKGERWTFWEELQTWLEKDMPNVDHRLTWWVADEKKEV